MQHLTCAQCQELFLRYVSGNLPELERHSVESHLVGCKACRAVLTQWQAVHEHLWQTRPQMPANLSGRVWQRVLTRLPEQRTQSPLYGTPEQENSYSHEMPDDAYDLTLPAPVPPKEQLMDFDEVSPPMATIPHTVTRRHQPVIRRSYPIVAAVLLAVTILTLIFFVHPGQQQQSGSTPTSTGGLVTSACGLAPVPLHLPSGAVVEILKMLSPSEGWMIGEIITPVHAHSQGQLLMHFHNCQWTQEHLPLHGVALDPLGFDMLTPTEGWAVGMIGSGQQTKGIVLHYHNGQWQQVTIPVETHTSPYGYARIEMTSPEDGWVEGSIATDVHPNGEVFSSNYVFRLKHGVWSIADPDFISQIPGEVVIQGGIVWGYGSKSAPDGGQGPPLIARYINDTWQPESLPASLTGLSGSIDSLNVLSPTDVWAVGSDDNPAGPLVLHYNGKAWSQVVLPKELQNPQWSTNGLIMVSPREGWTCGQDFSHNRQEGEPLYLHYLNGSWQRSSPLPANLFACRFSPSGSESWGLGEFPNSPNLVMIHLYNDQWKVTATIFRRN